MHPGTRPATVSLAATVVFVLLLALLHGLKPEIDPSWRFISEYALGDHGWLMAVAFLALATACIALAVALWPLLSGKIGRTGLVLLCLNGLGLATAAAFTTDPVTISHDEATLSGTIHSFGGMLGMAMPFAVAVIGWRLSGQAAGSAWRFAILAVSGLAFVGFLYAFVSLLMVLSQSGGRFGPDVPVGWPNRIEVAGYALWLSVSALAVIRAPLRGFAR